MSAIVTPNRATTALPDIPSRVFAAVRALLPRTLGRLFDLCAAQWYLLDERLLRDGGFSLVEAENARLLGRWGVPEVQTLRRSVCGGGFQKLQP